jgi:hypothetical protein
VARLVVSGAYKRLEDMGAPISARPVNMYPYVAPDEGYLILNSTVCRRQRKKPKR